MKKFLTAISVVLALALACVIAAGCSPGGGNDGSSSETDVSENDVLTAEALRTVLSGFLEMTEGTVSFGKDLETHESIDGLTETWEGRGKAEIKYEDGNVYSYGYVYDNADVLHNHTLGITYNGSYIREVCGDGETKIYGYAREEVPDGYGEWGYGIDAISDPFYKLFDGTVSEILERNDIDIYSDWTLTELIDKVREMPLSEMLELTAGIVNDIGNMCVLPGYYPYHDYWEDYWDRDAPEFLKAAAEYAGEVSFNDLLSLYDEIGADYGFTGENGLVIEFAEYMLDGFFGFSVTEENGGRTLIVTLDAGGKFGGYITRFADVFDPDVYTFNGAIKSLFGIDVRHLFEELKSSFGPECTLEDSMGIVIGYLGKYGMTERDVLQMLDAVFGAYGLVIDDVDVYEYYRSSKDKTLNEVFTEADFGGYDEAMDKLEKIIDEGDTDETKILPMFNGVGFPVFDDFRLDCCSIEFDISGGKLRGASMAGAADYSYRLYSGWYSVSCTEDGTCVAEEGYELGEVRTDSLDVWFEMTVDSGIETHPAYILGTKGLHIDREDLHAAFTEGSELRVALPYPLYGDFTLSVKDARAKIEFSDDTAEPVPGENVRIDGNELVLSGLSGLLSGMEYYDAVLDIEVTFTVHADGKDFDFVESYRSYRTPVSNSSRTEARLSAAT